MSRVREDSPSAIICIKSYHLAENYNVVRIETLNAYRDTKYASDEPTVETWQVSII